MTHGGRAESLGRPLLDCAALKNGGIDIGDVTLANDFIETVSGHQWRVTETSGELALKLRGKED